MRKILIACAVLASACGSDDQLIEPSPAPEVPTTAPELTSSTTLPDVTTTEAPTTTTTEPEPVWEPVATTIYEAPVAPREYLREQATTVPAARSTSSDLASIRACEQNTNPNAGPTGYASDTGNGYYGAYQFAWSTWASVGGSGNPAHASPAEQDMRAQMMIDAGRRGEWPNC